MANQKLREMSVGHARRVFQQQFTNDPELREIYKKYVDNNQQQLRTMGEAYRAIGKVGRIPSRQN